MRLSRGLRLMIVMLTAALSGCITLPHSAEIEPVEICLDWNEVSPSEILLLTRGRASAVIVDENEQWQIPEPPTATENAVRGYVVFGLSGEKRSFLVDKVKSSFYDTLYVDLNKDGNFTEGDLVATTSPEPVIRQYADNQFSRVPVSECTFTYFGPFVLDFTVEGAQKTRPFYLIVMEEKEIRSDNERSETPTSLDVTITLQPGAYYEGKTTIDDEAYVVTRRDSYCDGEFESVTLERSSDSEYADIMPWAKRLTLPRQGLFCWYDLVYAVSESTQENLVVLATPSRKLMTFASRCDWFNVELLGDESSIRLANAPYVRLPAGNYTLGSRSFFACDTDGALWQLTGFGQNDVSVSIPAHAANRQLPFGPPFKMKITAQQRSPHSNEFKLDLEVTGQAGEKYNQPQKLIARARTFVSAIPCEVLDKEGHTIWSGTLRWGGYLDITYGENVWICPRPGDYTLRPVIEALPFEIDILPTKIHVSGRPSEAHPSR